MITQIDLTSTAKPALAAINRGNQRSRGPRSFQPLTPLLTSTISPAASWPIGSGVECGGLELPSNPCTSTATNAAGPHPHEHLPRRRNRAVEFLHNQVAIVFEEKRFHTPTLRISPAQINLLRLRVGREAPCHPTPGVPALSCLPRPFAEMGSARILVAGPGPEATVRVKPGTRACSAFNFKRNVGPGWMPNSWTQPP